MTSAIYRVKTVKGGMIRDIAREYRRRRVFETRAKARAMRTVLILEASERVVKLNELVISYHRKLFYYEF